ncbi:MAG: hypothetical protein Q4F35_08565, partial [Akkermansia sp.]|nr:hypothetical protein [Akkermansia sp.]
SGCCSCACSGSGSCRCRSGNSPDQYSLISYLAAHSSAHAEHGASAAKLRFFLTKTELLLYN